VTRVEDREGALRSPRIDKQDEWERGKNSGISTKGTPGDYLGFTRGESIPNLELSSIIAKRRQESAQRGGRAGESAGREPDRRKWAQSYCMLAENGRLAHGRGNYAREPGSGIPHNSVK